MGNFAIPTIGAIQRTNIILVLVSAAILYSTLSVAAAVGCLLGGAVVIANLFILSQLGRLALAVASGGTATGARLGMLAIPLKMLLLVTIVYLAFSRAHIDGTGFGIGVLTQMIAVIIETARASVRGPSASDNPEAN